MRKLKYIAYFFLFFIPIAFGALRQLPAGYLDYTLSDDAIVTKSGRTMCRFKLSGFLWCKDSSSVETVMLGAASNGSAGQFLASAGSSAVQVWSTPTYPIISGSAGKFLRSDGTNNAYSTATIPDTATQYDLLYASAANVWSSLAKVNSAVLLSGAGGLPTWTAYATAFNTLSPMTAVGDLIYGGTSGAGTRLAPNTTSAINLLTETGTGAAGQAPAWSTPSAFLDAAFTSTQGAVLYRGAATWSALSPGTNGTPFVTGGAAANPSWAVLGVVGGGSGLATKTIHSIQIGNSTSADTQLAVGATGTLLGGVSSSDPAFSATPTLGAQSSATGKLNFAGTTSGVVTVQPQDAAGTYNFNLPTTAGSSGQCLLSGGGGSAAQTYGTLGIGGGGTGQVTKAPAFDALSPMSASGDIIYGGASGTGTRLAKGADGTVLTLASGIPSWAAASATPAYAGASTHINSTTTLTGNTYTDMAFTTEDWDTASAMSSSQFTCPNGHYYEVNAQVLLRAVMTATDQLNMRVMVNGAEGPGSWRYDATGSLTITEQAIVHTVIKCVSTQVVKLQVRAQGVSGFTVVSDNFANYFILSDLGV